MIDTNGIGKSRHYSRGIQLYDQGLYAEAISELKLALDSDHEDDTPQQKLASFYLCESYVNLGLAHLRMSMYARAEEDLKFALLLHPDYADLHFHLAVVYYRQRRFDEAEKQLQSALELNPRFARALIYLGLVRLRMGKEDGLACIEVAVRAEPAYSNDDYKQALASYHAADSEQALEIIEKVASLDVDQIGYLLEQSLNLMRRESYDEAAEILLEAISICPHYADLRHYLGVCYMHQDKMAEAIDWFKEALDLNPAFVMARISLAMAYQKVGHVDAARQELIHVLRIDPDNGMAEQMLFQLK